MKPKTNSRLSRSLKNIESWATSELPITNSAFLEYSRGYNSIGMTATQLFKVGMTNIGKSCRDIPTYPSGTDSKKLALGAIELAVADAINIERLKNTKRTALDDLDGITHTMFYALATGQFEVVKSFHKTVLEGLDNGYGVDDGHNLPIGTTLRYAAFGLSIIGDWLGKPLDLDKHALPRDPAWGQLVAHWREPDPEKLVPVLLAACDTHVERIALTSREVDSGNFEFGSPFEAVYPAEILAIRNLRRSLGLETPFIDHPLMNSPYAMLTLPPNAQLEHDELLEQFLKAACRYNPEAVPDGLYEAVRKTGAVR